MMLDEEQLLDRIYEAGAMPELWPAVLAQFDEVAGTAGSVLFAQQDNTLRWASSEPFAELVAGYMSGGYAVGDERTRRLLGARHAGFLTELDVFTPEEWAADPVRQAFWAPRGLGWGVATNVDVPTGEKLIFHGERRGEDGPPTRDAISRLDRLRPHLARAALLTNRLSFEMAHAAVTALEAIGLPAAVLHERGQALATNGLLDALTPDVVLARPSRLCLSDSRADALLDTALEALRAGVAPAVTQSVPIPALEGHPPMVLHVHPVRGVARDVFTRAIAVVVITPVVTAAVPSASVIQGLFDLTAAESKVARDLVAGLAPRDIAVQNGVAESTVRNQLRAVFQKTGQHRQTDLVRLLGGTSPRDADRE